jgi:hypothetical protein
MVYTQNITHYTIGLHILFNYNQNNHMYSQGRQEEEGGGGKLPWAPTWEQEGPTWEQEPKIE